MGGAAEEVYICGWRVGERESEGDSHFRLVCLPDFWADVHTFDVAVNFSVRSISSQVMGPSIDNGAKHIYLHI